MEKRTSIMKVIHALFLFGFSYLNSYGQYNIDFQNLFIDKIYQPDSISKKFQITQKFVLKEWNKDSTREISRTFYNKSGYAIKEMQFNYETGADTLTKTIDILPNTTFKVTYKVNPAIYIKLGDETFFGDFINEMRESKNKGEYFVLNLIYKMNIDSSFEIIKEANGKKIDSVHFVLNFKDRNITNLACPNLISKDTSYNKDSLIVTKIYGLREKKIEKLYYTNKGRNCVKEEYFNYKNDTLSHHGIIIRIYDKRNRLVFYSEQIDPPKPETIIEKIKYDKHNNRTLYRYTTPASLKTLPDYFFKYDSQGKMTMSGTNSNREINTINKTLYFYSEKKLLEKQQHYINDKLTFSIRYKYIFY